MAHPSVPQPKPLVSQPVDKARLPEDAVKMLKEMQAEVSPEATPLWRFVLDNAGRIAAGVLVVIALIVGYGIWQWRVEVGETKAVQDLARFSAMQDIPARIAALETFAAEAPSSVQIAVWLEIARSASELQDWDKAATAYKTVANNGKGAIQNSARMVYADILMRQGKFEDALKEREILLKDLPQNMRAAMLEQVAEAAEEMGDKKRAVEAYTEALSLLQASNITTAEYYRTRIAALQ